MARKKQSQAIDELVQSIQFVIENRCSQSEEDQLILNEALTKLHSLKFKKGKTNKEIRRIASETIELVFKYFIEDNVFGIDDVNNPDTL